MSLEPKVLQEMVRGQILFPKGHLAMFEGILGGGCHSSVVGRGRDAVKHPTMRRRIVPTNKE